MSRVCNGEPGLVNVQVEDPGTFDKGIYDATEPLIGCGTFSKLYVRNFDVGDNSMSNGDELNTSFVASLMNMGGSNFGTS